MQDPDSAPHQSETSLRPLIYSTDPPGLHFELLNFDFKKCCPDPAVTLMRIRIHRPKIMRIPAKDFALNIKLIDDYLVGGRFPPLESENGT
jgi:hypothetical protein